jgi:hypothetical protein
MHDWKDRHPRPHTLALRVPGPGADPTGRVLALIFSHERPLMGGGLDSPLPPVENLDPTVGSDRCDPAVRAENGDDEREYRSAERAVAGLDASVPGGGYDMVRLASPIFPRPLS